MTQCIDKNDYFSRYRQHRPPQVELHRLIGFGPGDIHLLSRPRALAGSLNDRQRFCRPTGHATERVEHFTVAALLQDNYLRRKRC